jgi:hypothetical protein
MSIQDCKKNIIVDVSHPTSPLVDNDYFIGFSHLLKDRQSFSLNVKNLTFFSPIKKYLCDKFMKLCDINSV